MSDTRFMWLNRQILLETLDFISEKGYLSAMDLHFEWASQCILFPSLAGNCLFELKRLDVVVHIREKYLLEYISHLLMLWNSGSGILTCFLVLKFGRSQRGPESPEDLQARYGILKER